MTRSALATTLSISNSNNKSACMVFTGYLFLRALRFSVSVSTAVTSNSSARSAAIADPTKPAPRTVIFFIKLFLFACPVSNNLFFFFG